jgi:molybdopterin molybdotransferase
VNVVNATQWDDARLRAYEAASTLPVEQVALADAVGRRLAADITALIDVPHYASSAMDGWAVAGQAPWKIVESGPLKPGEAIRIVTGGLVPDGARAVLRSESGHEEHSPDGTRLDRNQATAADEPADGMHIRPAGEEAHAGERVCAAGVTLNPAHVAVAAVCGHDVLTVARRARVDLVFTGDEVVTGGIPGPRQVSDSFGPQRHSLIEMLGGWTATGRRLPDSLDELTTTLTSAAAPALTTASPSPASAPADVIVTTGGTGHSPADHLHDALEAAGARILIDGIAMRPGGPTALAQLPAGQFVVGLPGNPLAAMMGIFTVVQPLLAAMHGTGLPELGHITIGQDLSTGRGRIRLIPYLLRDGRAFTSNWHGSGMLRGLAEADGVLVCPADGARAGDELRTLALPWAG